MFKNCTPGDQSCLCDSSQKVNNNCGIMCWFKNDNNCPDIDWPPHGKPVEISFDNKKFCCLKNVPFLENEQLPKNLDGYNCNLNDSNKLVLQNLIFEPSMKVLFVPEGDQEETIMFGSLMDITNRGQDSSICNSIQKQIWPEWSPPPPPPPSPGPSPPGPSPPTPSPPTPSPPTPSPPTPSSPSPLSIIIISILIIIIIIGIGLFLKGKMRKF
jgi:hypothetical protein